MSTFQASLVQFAYYGPTSRSPFRQRSSISRSATRPGCHLVISMGLEANNTRRLNLAQAFNPVGTNIESYSPPSSSA